MTTLADVKRVIEYVYSHAEGYDALFNVMGSRTDTAFALGFIKGDDDQVIRTTTAGQLFHQMISNEEFANRSGV